MQQELNRAVVDIVGGLARSIGFESDSAPASLSGVLHAEVVDLSPALTEMRRRKDPDEIKCNFLVENAPWPRGSSLSGILVEDSLLVTLSLLLSVLGYRIWKRAR